MEDVHDKRIMGYYHLGFDRTLYFSFPDRFQSLTSSNPSQVVYWVETKGKTLEEIDAIFEGEKHSSVPNVELLRQGKEHIDVGEVEQQIVAEVLGTKVK